RINETVMLKINLREIDAHLNAATQKLAALQDKPSTPANQAETKRVENDLIQITKQQLDTTAKLKEVESRFEKERREIIFKHRQPGDPQYFLTKEGNLVTQRELKLQDWKRRMDADVGPLVGKINRSGKSVSDARSKANSKELLTSR